MKVSLLSFIENHSLKNNPVIARFIAENEIGKKALDIGRNSCYYHALVVSIIALVVLQSTPTRTSQWQRGLSSRFRQRMREIVGNIQSCKRRILTENGLSYLEIN